MNFSIFLNYFKAKFFPITVVILFIILFGISFFSLIKRSRGVVDSIVAEEIDKLGKIFNRINSSCKIIGFEHKKNHIDFLTVEKFVGSEIGSMNLAYPSEWQGPYLKDNPTMQEKLYQIVKTNTGYFILPGNGVKLSNGKVIGEDIVIDESSDIEDMTKQENKLMSNRKALAIKISTDDSLFDKEKFKISSINSKKNQCHQPSELQVLV